MSTRWNDDATYESYGLGWDFVEQVKYEKENIKVMGKGGDVPYMNSSLLVAPDEQISIAVLTAGNGSSQYAGLMASALMDVALAERGKAVSDLTPPEPEIKDIIPDHYQNMRVYTAAAYSESPKYAGLHLTIPRCTRRNWALTTHCPKDLRLPKAEVLSG